MRKPSQSRDDFQGPSQKMSPGLVFTAADSYEKIGDGCRSKGGASSNGHELLGQKAEHTV